MSTNDPPHRLDDENPYGQPERAPAPSGSREPRRLDEFDPFDLFEQALARAATDGVRLLRRPTEREGWSIRHWKHAGSPAGQHRRLEYEGEGKGRIFDPATGETVLEVAYRSRTSPQRLRPLREALEDAKAAGVHEYGPLKRGDRPLSPAQVEGSPQFQDARYNRAEFYCNDQGQIVNGKTHAVLLEPDYLARTGKHHPGTEWEAYLDACDDGAIALRPYADPTAPPLSPVDWARRAGKDAPGDVYYDAKKKQIIDHATGDPTFVVVGRSRTSRNEPGSIAQALLDAEDAKVQGLVDFRKPGAASVTPADLRKSLQVAYENWAKTQPGTSGAPPETFYFDPLTGAIMNADGTIAFEPQPPLYPALPPGLQRSPDAPRLLRPLDPSLSGKIEKVPDPSATLDIDV